MKSDTAKSPSAKIGATTVDHYSAGLPDALATLCRLLQREIQKSLPKAASKLWHAMPVWFIGENPVVGYKATANQVSVLFWSGQLFDDSALEAVGKFKAAQVRFRHVKEVDLEKLREWLTKCATEIWDYRSHFKTQKAAPSRKKV